MLVARWWLLILILVAAAGLAVMFDRGQRVEYEATAGLIVEDPRASTLFEVTDLGRPSTQSSERYLADQVEILRSSEIANDASEKLDGRFSPQYILRNTTVAGDLNSNLIEVAFTAADAEGAQAGANAIALAYQELRRLQVQETAAVALVKVDALVVSLDTDIAELDRQIEESQAGNDTLQELNRQFVEAQAELNDLRRARAGFAIDSEERAAINAQIAELLADFSTWEVVLRLSERDSVLGNLIAEKNAAVEQKATLIARANSIEVDAELAAGGVSLFSEARLPDQPAGISFEIILALALAVGLALASALAYYLALRRWGTAGRDSPRAVLGAPLLAEVPNFKLEGIESSTPVRTNPSSASAEAFRFAASVIDIRMTGAESRSLMIVSATQGAGRTTFVANAGIAAAAEGLDVLLLDADFAKQDLNRLLTSGIPRSGLTDVVDGDTSLEAAALQIQVGGGQTVSVLSRGSKLVEAASYLRSSHSRTFFDLVADQFDLVLIDGPLILQVAYGSVLARYADAAIVVVEHGTEIQALEELREHLSLIELPILGYVYTKAPQLSAMPEVEAGEPPVSRLVDSRSPLPVGANQRAGESGAGDSEVLRSGSPWPARSRESEQDSDAESMTANPRAAAPEGGDEDAASTPAESPTK
jgi:Mrp family chromosome partitioning ATPase/capsular polysaccharide biosynthesis protein